MSKFDLTFCKVYIYARGWPGINLGASHESCTHSSKYLHVRFSWHKVLNVLKKLEYEYYLMLLLYTN